MPLFNKRVAGIFVGGSELVAVEAQDGAEGWVVKKCASAALPAGGPSAAEFKESIAGVLKDAGISARKIGVSIPDKAVKTVIFDLEELPAKEEDAEGIIKLKASMSLGLKPDDVEMDYHVLARNGSARIFAVLIGKEAFAAYERAFLDLGLDVERMNAHSINIVNLMSDKLAPAGSFSAITLFDGSFTIMFFKGGILDFYRCKAVRGEEDGLIKEVNASFLSYLGKTPGTVIDDVYLMCVDGALEEALKRHISSPVRRLRAEGLVRVESGVAGLPGGCERILAALGAAT